MNQTTILNPEFVETFPPYLLEDRLYISMSFATAVHICCCGCGHEVITPFSPTDWKLIFDGEHISLYPSIGNWSFACQSHYWIRENKVIWSNGWSQEEINEGRKYHQRSKQRYFDNALMPALDTRKKQETVKSASSKGTLWQQIKAYIQRYTR